MFQYVYNKYNTTCKALRTVFTHSMFLHQKCYSFARSLVRFLIRQQLVCKYRTPALSMKYSLFIFTGFHLFKRQIVLSTAQITIQRISIFETSCVIHDIEIFPLEQPGPERFLWVSKIPATKKSLSLCFFPYL